MLYTYKTKIYREDTSRYWGFSISIKNISGLIVVYVHVHWLPVYSNCLRSKLCTWCMRTNKVLCNILYLFQNLAWILMMNIFMIIDLQHIRLRYFVFIVVLQEYEFNYYIIFSPLFFYANWESRSTIVKSFPS